jgi:nicotinamidase-related amidase
MSNILRIAKKAQKNFQTGKEINFLFCDIQDRYITNIFNYKNVIEVAEDMAKASKILSLNQIVTLQGETDEVFGKTVPQISQHFDEKTQIFNKTKFAMLDENKLKSFDKDSIFVLLGIEAHVCVTQTALEILNNNLDVVIISDGVSSVKPGDRNRALRNLESMGAYVTTSQSFLYLLLQDYKHPQYKAILPIFKRQFTRDNKLLDEAKF